MVTSVSSSIQDTRPAQTTAPSKTSPTPASTSTEAPKTRSHSDTVQLSSAAQAALKELTETPSQTAKEASAGDSQAKHLLAKEAAQKPNNR